MEKKYSLSLFIFRRDLRIFDNTALIEALKSSAHVIVCFIFDPKQVTDKNDYKSNNAIQFMLESLSDLHDQLKKHSGHLYLFYGEPHDIIEDICKIKKIDALFINHDYTPYSLKRDAHIEKICKKLQIEFYAFHDLLLHAPDDVLTIANKPYTVFTPFYRAALKNPVTEPRQNNFKNYYTGKLITEKQPEEILKTFNKNIFVHGGRENGLKILKHIENFKDYENTRDFPELKTTGLSAHNKFGTLSIREEFHSMVKHLGASHMLVRQLYWRDFYTQIARHFPRVFGHSYLEKYDDLAWKNNPEDFKLWCEGKTGFPIVDAGMRQLNTTGWMHNRVRMIVASFLTKDLHIDWRMGEKYFAQHLVDYDPAVNNGSWQWAASTGCDPQPYFRIFNPWLQQQKFDPECLYIKCWVPELASYSPQIINALSTGKIDIPNYPKPMVDHAKQSAYAKEMFLKY
ncbi:MAG: DNA photolyase family protein [Candidatus Babeliaceae bacterium]|nr:DNA photolyase family protein [Candidatus Babeliaceae bacterium]